MATIPDSHDNWDVYLVDAKPGSPVRQLTTSPGMEGDPTYNWGDGTPRFSPDGKRVTYRRGRRSQKTAGTAWCKWA